MKNNTSDRYWDTLDDAVVDEILRLFADEDIVVTGIPKAGLLMLTLRDSFDVDFHLGEVLVTDARITWDGIEGYGMVMGEAPRKALARAAVDAVLRSGAPTVLRNSISAIIVRERLIREKLERETAILSASTRVNFDLM
jgi:alpha-D-ribose 1-methylphosphonate 5-triphosphate synthase subunit PhnG